MARNNVGVSQEEAARVLGVPRPAISQIESGKRSVSGLELAGLARLYRRPLLSFFEEGTGSDVSEDPVTILFRATELASVDQEVVREFDELCRNYSELEKLLDLERQVLMPDYGGVDEPRDKWEAVRQGEQVASEERRRLGVGNDPIHDVPELLDSQGVRLFIRRLEEGSISGLFLYDRAIGPCILINASEHPRRLPFNAAHEYAHVLLDRKLKSHVSSASRILSASVQHEELLEVRANSFSAAFLMPADGIERFLWDRGKTRSNRHSIGVVDVLLLQRTFGVSYKAALFRLQNLRWLDREQREELEGHQPDVLARELGLAEDPVEAREQPGGVGDYPIGYVYLALRAYQQGKISLGRLAELLNVTLENARELVWGLDVASDDSEDVDQLIGLPQS